MPAQFKFFTLLASAMLALSSSMACANDARDFFQDKRMTFIVATKPGGGYDTFARLVAKHLVKHLPVQSVSIKNIPGAGHLIGLSQLYTAKPDGLTIGTFNTGLVYTQMLKLEEMETDLRRLSWIGKGDSDTRVFIVGKQSGINNVAELKKHNPEILIATSGKTSASNIEMAMIARALGVHIKPVHGFGGAEAELAIMRGDVVGMLASYDSVRSFLEQGNGKALFYVGNKPAGLGNIPRLDAMVTDAMGREAVQLIASMAELGRLTAAPPGVPADRLAVLRDAYLQTLADPELLRETETLKLTLAPLGGAQVAQKINTFLSSPPPGALVLDEIR